MARVATTRPQKLSRASGALANAKHIHPGCGMVFAAPGAHRPQAHASGPWGPRPRELDLDGLSLHEPGQFTAQLRRQLANGLQANNLPTCSRLAPKLRAGSLELLPQLAQVPLELTPGCGTRLPWGANEGMAGLARPIV